jgi:thioredoxin 1
MSAVLEIRQSEFDHKVLEQEGLVVVDFTAKWCGPCQRLAPELEAAAMEVGQQASVVKIDVDEAPDVAMTYGVQGIPNLTFFKAGKVVDVAVGLQPKAAIVERIKRNLSRAESARLA